MKRLVAFTIIQRKSRGCHAILQICNAKHESPWGVSKRQMLAYQKGKKKQRLVSRKARAKKGHLLELESTSSCISLTLTALPHADAGCWRDDTSFFPLRLREIQRQ